MRPRLSWADLAGARVGVFGLGVEGAANAARLAALGAAAVLVDDRPPAGGFEGRPVLATHGGGIEALLGCDVVVKSPGISRRRPELARLAAAAVPVAGGLGLWLEQQPPGRVVGVTGTKGKSTTSAVLGHLLAGLGVRVELGGNLGRPPWDPAADAADAAAELWVVEISSFQATDLSCSPSVVAATSLHPDHLDWHGSAEAYYADKLSACSQPGAALTVANADSEALAARAALLGPRVVWVREADDPEAAWAAPLGLPGRHNRHNARIARACLAALGVAAAADPAALAAAAEGFEGLASRLRTIGSVGGVEFVDDSLATNVLPTLAALDAFAERRVALLVGGHDRGIDYTALGEGLAARRAPTLLACLPDNGPRILAEAGPGAAAGGGHAAGFEDLAAAVEAGLRFAHPDGVVLLSPASPSFGRYRDYRDRAAHFAAIFAGLAGLAERGGPAGR